jgi:hypothetical protein
MVHLVSHLMWPVARPLTQWAEGSQRKACRNAMVASTAIAATRQESAETQEYVATLIARRARRAGPATLPAARLG